MESLRRDFVYPEGVTEEQFKMAIMQFVAGLDPVKVLNCGDVSTTEMLRKWHIQEAEGDEARGSDRAAAIEMKRLLCRFILWASGPADTTGPKTSKSYIEFLDANLKKDGLPTLSEEAQILIDMVQRLVCENDRGVITAEADRLATGIFRESGIPPLDFAENILLYPASFYLKVGGREDALRVAGEIKEDVGESSLPLPGAIRQRVEQVFAFIQANAR